MQFSRGLEGGASERGRRRMKAALRHLTHDARWLFRDTVPRLFFQSFDRLRALAEAVRRVGPSEDTHGPVVLLIPSKHHGQVRWRMLDWLSIDNSASTRMHGGIVVPRTKEVLSVGQSPYIPERGRRVESSSHGIQQGVEYQGLLAAIQSLEPAHGYSHPTTRQLFRALEVITFSAVPLRVWERMKRSRFLRRRLAFLGSFDATDAFSRLYLWDSLPLYAAADSGTWFERLQDSPEFGWPPSDDASFFVSESYAREPKRAVLFASFGDEIFFERGARSTKFPRDLPPIGKLSEPPLDPSLRAAKFVGRQPTTRISSQDDPSVGTQYDVAPIGLRYPDPMAVVNKIERYCLAPGHSDGKWNGFAVAGYESSRADDAYLLAASISSSLLFEPLMDDLRTTADGGLQFGVDVALPSRRGGLARVTTSWILTSSKSPWLGTAFVTAPRGAPLAKTLTVPAGIEHDFSAVATWVKDESAAFAADRFSDGGAAFGWLWVRHDHDRSAEFARWLRRNGEGSGIFRRARLGGRVTQWSLSGNDGSSTEARLAFAQTALLILGIRTHAEFVWD